MQENQPERYDSRADTLAHIERVQSLIKAAIENLANRATVHDQSKLEEPEKSVFDACTIKLKSIPYGSDEYKAALAELKPALDHHYAANSHHPEFYPKRHGGFFAAMLRSIADAQEEQANPALHNPSEKAAAQALLGTAKFVRATADQLEAEVNGMSLFDLLEMLLDWKAATERMQGGGDIMRSIEINTSRFNLSPQLVQILRNTVAEMKWIPVDQP